MDFYGFAATAIPVLWAACRIIQPPRVPHRWQTAGWLGLKLLLIAGEIAAVVALGRGHDKSVDAALAVCALIAGALVVVVGPVARDLSRLGLRTRAMSFGSFLSVAVIGWVALRFS